MYLAKYKGRAASYTIVGFTFKRGSSRQISLANPSEKYLYELLVNNPDFELEDLTLAQEPTVEASASIETEIETFSIDLGNEDAMPQEDSEDVLDGVDLFPLKQTEQPQQQKASSKRGKR